MTREARGIPDLHYFGMGDDPRIIGIASRVMAAITLGPNGVGAGGVVTCRAAIGVVFKEGYRVICLVPSLGMRHLEAVTGGAELSLRVTRLTCALGSGIHDVWMSRKPRVVDIAVRVMARIAVGSGSGSDVGRVARVAAFIAHVDGSLNMGVHEAVGVGHLQAVTGITELLL